MSWKGTWRHMLRSSVLTRPSQRGIVYISSSSDTHMGTVTDRDAVLLLGVDVDPSQRCVNQPRMGRKKKKCEKKSLDHLHRMGPLREVPAPICSKRSCTLRQRTLLEHDQRQPVTEPTSSLRLAEKDGCWPELVHCCNFCKAWRCLPWHGSSSLVAA
ncbi:hypothetical protein CPAR01_13535 [Colletotrichum paranaense]|uniref:Uncharacterized protein n=2 Tax=Colletotrichum acutatum species complex TaxID=2707335 RepID=A0AAI9UYK1_9PEZI|nr:uncharacterized protein CPAR01_13535 [Colletotrichum paranaense]KAK1467219.1 hypothetical protein CMEL01_11212 [Colletotrichum melonis]KAK1524587.1 hypothetical protein CPAR01_13535 [Colletotrichum paranaense]